MADEDKFRFDKHVWRLNPGWFPHSCVLKGQLGGIVFFKKANGLQEMQLTVNEKMAVVLL